MKLNNPSDCSKYNILSFKKKNYYFEYKSQDYSHPSSLNITYMRTVPHQGGTGQRGQGPGF